MFKDAEYTNEDFYNGSFTRMDFTRSEFTNCDFYDCDFEKVDFLGAMFTNCDFHGCNFNSYLTGVRFENCDFHECSFDEAYIFRSQFKNCEFCDGCSMSDALLSTVDFTGTTFKNLMWNGTAINSAPIIIEGIESPVIVLDNGYMHIGCQYNTYEWMYNCPDREVSAMEGLRSRRFWKKNKRWIFQMLEDRGLWKP